MTRRTIGRTIYARWEHSFHLVADAGVKFSARRRSSLVISERSAETSQTDAVFLLCNIIATRALVFASSEAGAIDWTLTSVPDDEMSEMFTSLPKRRLAILSIANASRNALATVG